jgi:hypothetical protein
MWHENNHRQCVNRCVPVKLYFKSKWVDFIVWEAEKRKNRTFLLEQGLKHRERCCLPLRLGTAAGFKGSSE